MSDSEELSDIAQVLAHTLKGRRSEQLRVGPCPDSWTLAKLALGEVDETTRQQLNFHIPFCESCLDDYVALVGSEELQVITRVHKRSASWLAVYEFDFDGGHINAHFDYNCGKGRLDVLLREAGTASLYTVDKETEREALIFHKAHRGSVDIRFDATSADLYRCELNVRDKTLSLHLDVERRGLGWRDARNIKIGSNKYKVSVLIGHKLFWSIVPISGDRRIVEVRVETEKGDLVRQFSTLKDGSLDFVLKKLPPTQMYLFYVSLGQVTKRIAYIVHGEAVEDWTNMDQLTGIIRKVSGA